MMSAVLVWLRRPGVLRTAQILIGAVFLVAALAKIADLHTFAMQLHNYRMTPVWIENLLAMTLPWVELLAALSLLFGVRPRSGAVLVLGMMLVFTFGVVVAWARGLDVSCGCFGKALSGQVGAQKFFENVGLILLAGVASLRRNG
jgi:uncharacterized membrane protein YphA (DoxX/SURF4 family)